MFCFWFWIGWWENLKSLIYRIALNGRVKLIGFKTQASERGRGRISISFFFVSALLLRSTGGHALFSS